MHLNILNKHSKNIAMISHDELIWKHLDGECTPEESAMTDHLLAVDADFRAKYTECRNLDIALSEGMSQPLSDAYKTVLIRTLEQALPATAPVRPLSQILGPGWLLAIIAAGGAAVIIAWFFGNTASGLPFSIPMPDSRTINIIALVCLGFLLLTAFDQALQKWYGKHRGVTTMLV